ncbi:MAG: flagellar basal body rod protein FlgB [Phycisphaerae bacterium]|nr:flagellar basal body rod protein FlgB [Phycisphaerae bacterium]
MWMDNLINAGSGPVLEKVAAFSEARHRVLAENIANIDTPGYRTKHLDAKAFQAKLAEAVAARQKEPTAPLRLKSTRQFHVDDQGMLRVTPTLTPSENILFHDGTNASIERQMASLAENTMMHQISVDLMRGRFASLRKAISGRVA